MRFVLVGNFGVGNAGDEILREYFLERLPEVEWIVGGGEYPRFPSGLRSFLSLRWMRTVSALRKSDGMVFGGGSLFTDVESPRACWVWFCHAIAAWLFRKPILLTFQGIGPFRTRRGRWLAEWVVRRSAFLSVRDGASKERVGRWKKNTDVIQTFDPSILLMDKQKTDLRTKNVINFIPRFSTGKKQRELVESLRRSGKEVRVYSLQPGDGWEAEHVRSLRELSSQLEGECVITQRYHGAIAAIAAGIPFIAIRQREGDKLDALAQAAGACSRNDLTKQAEYGERALKEALNQIAKEGAIQ